VDHCREELAKLPVKMLTPDDPDSIAGILAFTHPDAERIHAELHRQDIHVMSHAGRLRVAIHGYNRLDQIDAFLAALRSSLVVSA
jgi:cysteine desulfurase / selenocysteine lyase